MRTCKKERELNQARWLAAFKAKGTIRGACDATGIARSCYYKWMHDPAFKERFEDTDAEVTDVLEGAAMKHAIEGNATLLIFLLKSRKPEKYRDEFHLTHRTMTLEDWLRGQGAGAAAGASGKGSASAAIAKAASATGATPRSGASALDPATGGEADDGDESGDPDPRKDGGAGEEPEQ